MRPSFRLPVVLLLAALAVFALASRFHQSMIGLFASPGETRLDQEVVLERVRAVAKLATTEVTLRDVVVYENTWLGSTKRSLVVVSATALVGFDLEDQARVTMEESARVIRVALPRPGLVSLDIRGMETYDERRGLWNAFHPADRDTIYRQARAQLARAAVARSTLNRAEAGAREILGTLFAPSGYRVEVVFETPRRGGTPGS